MAHTSSCATCTYYNNNKISAKVTLVFSKSMDPGIYGFTWKREIFFCVFYMNTEIVTIGVVEYFCKNFISVTIC